MKAFQQARRQLRGIKEAFQQARRQLRGIKEAESAFDALAEQVRVFTESMREHAAYREMLENQRRLFKQFNDCEETRKSPPVKAGSKRENSEESNHGLDGLHVCLLSLASLLFMQLLSWSRCHESGVAFGLQALNCA
jgi:hypothetical protein